MNDKAERYQGDTVVFDTETLAMDKKAVVLTLSAVRFNKHDAEVGITIDNGRLSTEGENVLHLTLNVTEQLLAGRTVDPGTVAWWNKQGKEALDGIINGSNTPVREALILLSDFMKGAQPFARGTDFDPPILVSLFEDFSLPVPWKYNQARDVRTYIDALSGGSKGYLDEWQKPDWFVPHHSLHDCIRDAEQMQLAEGQVSRGNE